MAVVSDKNIRRLRAIAGGFTKLLKSTIKRLGLIETGRLVFETAVKLKINQRTGDFRLIILSTDYYKFLDDGTINMDAFNITDKAFSGPKFNRLVKQLENTMVSIVEDNITGIDE